MSENRQHPQMRTLILEALVRAETPISHNGGEKNGNMGLFRTQEMWYETSKGKSDSVFCPTISGNSIRSNLRKMSSRIFLDELGEDGSPLTVDKRQFNMLMSGGGQVSKTDKSEKKMDGAVGAFKDIRENVTPLSLFGTSKGNAMLPGKLDIHGMYPVGYETHWTMSEAFRAHAELEMPKESVSEFLKLEFNTTKDSRLDPALQAYLDDPDSLDEEEQKSIQMLYYSQVLAAGTPLYWKVVLRDVTPEEYGLFINALTAFEKKGALGGNRRIGWGKFKIEAALWTDVTTLEDNVLVESKDSQKLYLEFLAERKSSTREFLKNTF